MAYVVNCLLRGEPALCSEGRQILDFMHVEDASSALVARWGLEPKERSISDRVIRIVVRDVLQEIGRKLGRPELIRFGARSSTLKPSHFWANTQRLMNEVGWTPQYDLTRGIQHAIEWWRVRWLSPSKQQPKASDDEASS